MALDLWTNTGLSTLASGINASQTTLTVASGTGSRFPADSFNIVVWNSTDFANPIDAADREIVRCTSRSGDVLTIIRGQEGTSGVAHNTAGKTYSVALIVSKKFRDDLHALIFQNVSVQVFTGSGTYTKPSNLIAARVVVVGAGGGGGTADAVGNATAAGAGGGAGGYAESFLLASAIGATETVTGAVGGGAGAAGGGASFGALVTANGGAGGGNGVTVQGAAGGAAGTGQVAHVGGRGGTGVSMGGTLVEAFALGGQGGASVFGNGGAGGGVRTTTNGAQAGQTATGFTGAGGGGGASAGASGGGDPAAAAGGSGSSGIVIVWEYKAG